MSTIQPGTRVATRTCDHRIRVRRRFTILDALVMIVPLAVGFVLARPFVTNFLFLLASPDSTPWWFKRSGLVIGLASRFAALGLIGLVVASLLPPRQTLRRLSRQPGAVACAAAAAAMAAGGLIVLSLALFRQRSISSADENYWPFIEARIFLAIAAAWVTQALSGRWRPEPNWIDRAGRVLGAYWITLFLYRYVMSYVWPGFWIEPR
jgi:hypothetical protein